MGRQVELVVFLLSLTLVCGSASGRTSPLSPVSAVNRTVWYYSWLSSASGFAAGDINAVNLFNTYAANYAVIRREILPTVTNLASGFLPLISGSPGPDVLQSYGVAAGHPSTPRLFRPVSDIWKRNNLTTRVPPGIARYCSGVDGEYYFLPLSVDSLHLEYRLPDLQAMGLPPPTTWSELLRVCAGFTAMGKMCLSHSRSSDAGLLQILDVVLAGTSGIDALLAFQGGTLPFTSSLLRAAAERIAQLGALGFIDLAGNRLDKPAGWTANILDFFYGRAGMIIGFDSVRQFITDKADYASIRAAAWPRSKAGDPSAPLVLQMFAFTMPQVASNVPGAVQFMETIMQLYTASGNSNGTSRTLLPANVDPQTIPPLASDPVRLELLMVLRSGAPVADQSAISYALPGVKSVLFGLTSPVVSWLKAVSTQSLNVSMQQWDELAAQLEAMRLEESSHVTDTPRMSKPGGEYTSNVTVTLSCATKAASIYYNISLQSGSNDTTFTLYSPGTPLSLYSSDGQAMVLTAFASRDLLKRSNFVKSVYVFPAPPQQALADSIKATSSTWLGATVSAILIFGVCAALLFLLLAVRRRRRAQVGTSNELQIWHRTIIDPGAVTVTRQLTASGVFVGRYRATDVAIKVLGNGDALSTDISAEATMSLFDILAPFAVTAGAASRVTLDLSLEQDSRDDRGTDRAMDEAPYDNAPNKPPPPALHGRLLFLMPNKAGRLPMRANNKAFSYHSAYGSGTAKAAQTEFQRRYGAFVAESEALCLLRHPNIVLAMGVVLKPRICIVTEYMPNGSLYSQLRSIRGSGEVLNPKLTYRWAQQIALGLEYLHACKLCHGDIKSPNVLLSSQWTAKIADFGTVFKTRPRLDTDESPVALTAAQRETMGYSVSAAWSAPELLANKPLTAAVDIYSLSVVFWELITLQRPYANMSAMQLDSTSMTIVLGVCSGTLRPDIELIPKSMRLAVLPLLEQMWSQNPAERPSASAVAKILMLTSSWSAPTEQTAESTALYRRASTRSAQSGTIGRLFPELRKTADESSRLYSDQVVVPATLAGEDMGTLSSFAGTYPTQRAVTSSSTTMITTMQSPGASAPSVQSPGSGTVISGRWSVDHVAAPLRLTGEDSDTLSSFTSQLSDDGGPFASAAAFAEPYRPAYPLDHPEATCSAVTVPSILPS